MFKNLIRGLKRIKFHHIVNLWKFPVAIIVMPFYKMIHKNLWIVCEDMNEARDNGYWLFKYLIKEHPEQDCVYAIKKNSPDYNKVASIGKTVEYGSLKHWIMYLTSSKKISSQKAGNPNPALFYFLEVYGLLKDKRVFLQHGVIKDDLKWLYYSVTKMNRFICGAYPEYKYVSSQYGYPNGYVKYTGLCRFDGLHDGVLKERMILIMPTWREWIADGDERLEQYEGTSVIQKTKYFLAWNDFIKDEKFKQILIDNNVKCVFFPHRNMQRYIEFFPESDETIEVSEASKYDVQDLLKRASLMITDYSSVFFDMLYMKKPVLFYQFDYDTFRKAQYNEGYFSYENNPFGESYRTKEELLCAIEKNIKNDFSVSDDFLNAHNNYFRLYDTNNCKRVYEVIKDL